MSGVSRIGSALYPLPGVRPAGQCRPRRVVLPELLNRHFPTYNDGLSVGQEALARIRKANLAAAAAIYVYRQLGPG